MNRYIDRPRLIETKRREKAGYILDMSQRRPRPSSQRLQFLPGQVSVSMLDFEQRLNDHGVIRDKLTRHRTPIRATGNCEAEPKAPLI
jgi:hypothetical protein